MANRVISTREANRFLAMFSNAPALARLLNNISDSEAKHSGGTPQLPSPWTHPIYGFGDKILQLPIAREEKLISHFHDMKARLANDSTSLEEGSLEFAKIIRTIAEMRMAVVEVQLGSYIECMRAIWPDFVEARSLVAEVADVLASLQSLGASDQVATENGVKQEEQALIDEFMRKASPFLEGNSSHRKSATEFVRNPAAVFPEISAT